MDWIDSCMKKWKTNIFLIFVVIFSGASEDVYSKNICIANGSDVFRPLSVLDEQKINNEIRITSGANSITAGQAIYDEGGGSITISGGISLENPNLLIEGQQALINTDKETAIINNANYFFSNIPARGSSEEFRIEEGNNYVLIKPTYTTCNQLDQSWELVADEILINEDEGKAKNIALRFKNIPLL